MTEPQETHPADEDLLKRTPDTLSLVDRERLYGTDNAAKAAQIQAKRMYEATSGGSDA